MVARDGIEPPDASLFRAGLDQFYLTDLIVLSSHLYSQNTPIIGMIME